jgi:hypothetical protein
MRSLCCLRTHKSNEKYDSEYLGGNLSSISVVGQVYHNCILPEQKAITCDPDYFTDTPIPLRTYTFLYLANLQIMRVISFINHKKFLVKVLPFALCPPDLLFQRVSAKHITKNWMGRRRGTRIE